MNYDFSGHGLHDVVTDELIRSTTGIRGLVDNIWAHVGGDIRIRDLASHRATLLQGPRFVGNGRQVADQMEVPELLRRGLFRRSYAGDTLRAHLGLDKPLMAPAMSQGGASA
jgi:hypothetical protein